MRLKALLVPAILAALVSSAGALSQRPRVTGFFSDFRYHGESGDVGGVEIFISYALVKNGLDARHYAYVQIAEGVPDEPQLVQVTVAGSRITFRLAGQYERISPFSGTVTRDSLIGRFSNGWELRLPRRASYWQ